MCLQAAFPASMIHSADKPFARLAQSKVRYKPILYEFTLFLISMVMLHSLVKLASSHSA
jgi:hypothetical protein